MAYLNHPGREDPSESTAPTLRRPKGEQDRSALSKAEMGESLKCGGTANPVSVLGLSSLRVPSAVRAALPVGVHSHRHC
ncbi:MAG: hypothetical protein ACI8RZ_003720 [Myxococcota bacterium]|jgi:hypothetical protein